MKSGPALEEVYGADVSDYYPRASPSSAEANETQKPTPAVPLTDSVCVEGGIHLVHLDFSSRKATVFPHDESKSWSRALDLVSAAPLKIRPLD